MTFWTHKLIEIQSAEFEVKAKTIEEASQKLSDHPEYQKLPLASELSKTIGPFTEVSSGTWKVTVTVNKSETYKEYRIMFASNGYEHPINRIPVKGFEDVPFVCEVVETLEEAKGIAATLKTLSYVTAVKIIEITPDNIKAVG